MSYLLGHLYNESSKRSERVHLLHDTAESSNPHHHYHYPGTCIRKTCHNFVEEFLESSCCTCRNSQYIGRNDTGTDADKCVQSENCEYDNEDERNNHVKSYAVTNLFKQGNCRRSFFCEECPYIIRNLVYNMRTINCFTRKTHCHACNEETDASECQTHYGPNTLVSDSVYYLYALNTGRYDSGIGDKTDVVAEAGTACDRADCKVKVTAYDFVQP